MVRGGQARTARQEVSDAFEKLGTGFLFTEGPVWHPTGKFLLFSDMPGDHLRRWSAADGVTTFRRPCNMSNGLVWDRQGRLVACEHATSRLTRTEPDGRIVPLATHWRGKQLNSPNDVVCRSDGGIYFSDPPYGRAAFYGVERPQELDLQGVYRVGPEPRTPELLVDDFDRPNGLCFSLDERRLFINDTARQHIRVFDVAPDGTLAHGRLWAETKGDAPGGPDGMKLDSAGNVYCCGPGGIHVFDADANLLEVIEVPEYTANFAWGDDDYRSLFITASTSLYRIRTKTPGRPVF
ncbi:MAG: SMP-30/gluconolactonase/LRE family protein [Candidatus Rokubacteria bacterium]|nr:SMP-30/gluconolactonase/LRE family protein [Candidatus Rokubacteria bacterium]